MNNSECSCMCSNCKEGYECHYSSYHCKHANRNKYGHLEGHGFCIVTGFVPDNAWFMSNTIFKRANEENASDIIILAYELLREAYIIRKIYETYRD